MRFLLASAALLCALPVHAQVTVLDEGTFSHLLNGVRMGREDFSIRAARSAPGATYVAQANVLAGERRRTLLLSADSLGGPVRLQLEVREANQVVENVAGDRQRMVWSGRILSAARESARETRLTPETFLAEPGVVHHLWFVLRFGQGRSVELFSPSGLSMQTVRLASAGPDSVEIAGRSLAATRWTLQRVADNGVAWELWADRAGRILRARHLASGLEAIRDDPPAETTGR